MDNEELRRQWIAVLDGLSHEEARIMLQYAQAERERFMSRTISSDTYEQMIGMFAGDPMLSSMVESEPEVEERWALSPILVT